MIHLNKLFFIFFISLSVSIFSEELTSSSLNLDKNISPFILKTKKIKIPGFPYAFNPSIIKIKDRFLLSFRVIPKKKSLKQNNQSIGESEIGLIFLDSDFEPIGEAFILKLNQNEGIPSRSEDARLLSVGKKIFLTYSDNQDMHLTPAGFRMYIAELQIKSYDDIQVLYSKPLLKFVGENAKRREKNWVPFDYQGKLLLAYSLNPHVIFSPYLSKNYAKKIALTFTDSKWNYGELRGGTPALLDEDEYLAFFHSSKMMSTQHSKEKNALHYFMGAYTFNKKPPFEITSISKEPFFCQGFYSGREYKPYWKPVQVVFPCGFVMDDHYIYISYGRQDHEIWMMKLDKKGLKKSLHKL